MNPNKKSYKRVISDAEDLLEYSDNFALNYSIVVHALILASEACVLAENKEQFNKAADFRQKAKVLLTEIFTETA